VNWNLRRGVYTPNNDIQSTPKGSGTIKNLILSVNGSSLAVLNPQPGCFLGLV